MYTEPKSEIRTYAAPCNYSVEHKREGGPKLLASNAQDSYLRRIRGTLFGMVSLLAFDIAILGSFTLSLIVCPVWFLVSTVKAIIQRPGWRIGLSRVAIPVLTIAIVWGNATLQKKVGGANAEQIIKACEQFHEANGRYPTQLSELVPNHLKSVPRSKYCLMFSEFRYISSDRKHIFVWVIIPPFGRKTYDFEEGRWGILD